ncbi:MAG: biotin/lipoyl-binding protein, partial [Ignavibacteria bacterium]|nr:biotin/lipoyl-binding protein [Ignavibacteria bacterium]
MSHSDNISASLDVNEIYNRKPIWLIRWGTFIFLMIAVLLFFSAWYIKYPEFISTPITFIGGNHTLNIYSNNSGIIKYINYHDGDKVKNGDVIAILENAADFKSILLLKTILEKNDAIVNKETTEFFEMNSFLSLGELYKDFALLRKCYFDYREKNDANTREKYREKLGNLKNSLELFEFRYLIKSPVSGIISINYNNLTNKYIDETSIIAVIYQEEHDQISGRIKLD